jgi:pimeloyl-ACP methyl ester carboxylesterase
MPITTINGLTINYLTRGSGPALLMLAPGGFDATIEKWSTAGVWQKVRPLETFTEQFTCVAYDRRECGASGGRVEHLSWRLYAEEAKGLLDRLGIKEAFVMGGCMGCSVAIAFATQFPQVTRGMVLHWPVGGAEWIQITHERWLGVHAGFVKEQGLAAVVELAREKKSFMADFRAGPWAAVIARDADFAAGYAAQNVEAYLKLISEITATMYDRDTAPGAEPEELRKLQMPALVIPGDDPYHSTLAAQYLALQMRHSEYWDLPVMHQDGDLVREKIRAFLLRHSQQ